MRLLLDTHVADWILTARTLVPGRVRDLVRDPNNKVYVSAVTIWEIAIKNALPRAKHFPFSAAEAISLFEEAAFMLLPVTPQHAAAVETLPRLHGDPLTG